MQFLVPITFGSPTPCQRHGALGEPGRLGGLIAADLSIY